MAELVTGPVTVTVPATSANLGPGYDALGLALELRDTLTAEVIDGPNQIEVRGEGADDVPRDASHLVVQAMFRAFATMGIDLPGIALSCDNVLPHARGLGSSSGAIVGGIGLAVSLVSDADRRLDLDARFRLAAEIEGHPDNVAPATYGGLTISGQEDAWFTAAIEVLPRIAATAFVPPHSVSTELARSLLPAHVPHAEAAANAGRTALLIAGLTQEPSWLWAATRDWLHQDYRRAAMPESYDFVQSMRADGYAAYISGAGPTVVVLHDGPGHIADRSPDGWTVHELSVSDGVRLPT